MKVLSKFSKDSKGYTLIEVLLVVAIITVVLSVSVPIYESLQNSNGLDVTVNSLAQDLEQAQILSRSEEHNSGWGVAIEGQTIVLYAGSSYTSRNTSYDSIFNMPVNVQSSGLSEIDFSKLYGLPNNTGIFTMKSLNTTRTLSINAKGLVDY